MAQNNSREERPGSLAPRARRLRRQATAAERALWRLLRRQHPFGPYVLAFFCMGSKLAVEADGGQHYTAQGWEHDEVRTRYLQHRGIRVLRFSDREVVLNGEAVLAVIEAALGSL